jgi:formylglycine-generating enzyme required for sulfatase activity
MQQIDWTRLSRRRFLAALASGAGGVVVGGCGRRVSEGNPPEPTGDAPPPEAGDAPPPPKLEPFTEVIPDTDVALEMLPIPGGTFTMADPYGNGPREVTIQPFWMLKTEVTWDAYSLFAYGHPLSERLREFASVYDADALTRPTDPFLPPGPDHRHWGRSGEPAIRISYYAATRFCEWLSEKTGRKYRLPTEAEWEYACRAGAAPGAIPAGGPPLDEAAWYADNSDDEPRPVATKAPNAWGLHDMLGNVAEWCVGLGDEPVVRGGSFEDPAEDVHPARREYHSPAWQESDYQDPKSRWWLHDAPHVGFRLVCDPS